MQNSFPLDYQPLERDWPNKKMYNDWIKSYEDKKKSEVLRGYAIKGKYECKLTSSDLLKIKKFNELFDYVISNLDGTNRDKALLYFIRERIKHKNISDSYFIWCCEIICLKNDIIKKFGK